MRHSPLPLVILALVACGNNEPPPRTEVSLTTPPPPPPPSATSAKATPRANAEEPSDEELLARLQLDAGTTGALAPVDGGFAEAFGTGGLARVGFDDESGNIGSGPFGHGSGSGSGQGFGSGHGRLGGAHATTTSVRQGTTTVNGKLPPEVIQRIVRQSFGQFRVCYEKELRNTPTLQGRLAIRFVIDATGTTTNVAPQASSSTLTNAAVSSCVVDAFKKLVFPTPEGGAVTVVYPMIFAPTAD